MERQIRREKCLFNSEICFCEREYKKAFTIVFQNENVVLFFFSFKLKLGFHNTSSCSTQVLRFLEREKKTISMFFFFFFIRILCCLVVKLIFISKNTKCSSRPKRGMRDGWSSICLYWPKHSTVFITTKQHSSLLQPL